MKQHKEMLGALKRGDRVVTGGGRPDGAGWFYPPTVVAEVTPAMRLHLEEAFGPVATVYSVPGVAEAIELANATPFGLSSAVWTTDAAEQQRFVAEVDAGGVFINGMTISYPELAFGGIKNSGFGRELGEVGMKEFCNMKTVWAA